MVYLGNGDYYGENINKKIPLEQAKEMTKSLPNWWQKSLIKKWQKEGFIE